MVNIHWAKLSKPNAGLSLQSLTDNIRSLPKGQLWRHNVAGDIPSDSRGNIIPEYLAEITRANIGRKGFTYTHNDTLKNKANQALIKWANNQGFAVNLSADSLSEADKLKALNIGPVVTILPEWKPGDSKVIKTPGNNMVVICPAVTKEGIQCINCGLCANTDRHSIIGFPVHGIGKKKAMKVFMMKTEGI